MNNENSTQRAKRAAAEYFIDKKSQNKKISLVDSYEVVI